MRRTTTNFFFSLMFSQIVSRANERLIKKNKTETKCHLAQSNTKMNGSFAFIFALREHFKKEIRGKEKEKQIQQQKQKRIHLK